MTTWKIENLLQHCSTVNGEMSNGTWGAVRPLAASGFYGLRLRIKAAWLVFTGQADAVVWEDGE